AGSGVRSRHRVAGGILNAVSGKAAKTKRGKRRAAPPPPKIPIVITNHGLEARYFAGTVIVEEKAADPDQPNRTFNRARICNVYDRLHNRGENTGLSREQRDAAERYAELREKELGSSRIGGISETGGNLPPWQRSNASDNQMAAMEKLRGLHRIVGPRGELLLGLLIVDNLNVGQIAAQFSYTHPVTGNRIEYSEKVVVGWLQFTLQRTAEHLGIADVRGK
ncbi:MAG: hypothetical protein ACRYGG_13730, partial [Janthinobacterium lividum]